MGRRFQADRDALIARRLSDLSADQLAGVDARLAADAEELAGALAALRGRSDAALAEHDWRAVQADRARAVDLGRDFDELEELRNQVRDALLERRLNDHLAARLGSERRRLVYDGVIMALITGVLGVLIVQEVVVVSDDTALLLDLLDVAACVVFLADFAWRHHLAEDKRWYWRRHWVDFVTSIPLPSMQTLRLGRGLRLLRFVRLLRLARVARILRVALFFWRGMDKLAAAFDVRMMRRSVSILVVVLILGALGIWSVEGHAEAEGVEDLGQSLWWSFTTVVTGGFGDIRNPATVPGRLLTAALIIAGMVVVGIFTATLTSLLVREGDLSGEILALEERMLGELRRLREELGRGGEDAPRD